MKKTFFKSVVATAVVTAAVALSSVAAFAATTVYNVSNLTNAGTKVSAGDVLTFSDVDATDVNITWGGGGADIMEGTFTGAAPEGVTFTKRLRPTGGNRSITITLPAEATVDFYVCSTNSSDAGREATYTFTDGVTTYTSDPLTNASGTEALKVSYTVAAAGNYTLTTSKDRLTLFGIAVTTNDGPTVYWPNIDAQTSAVTQWFGGNPTNLLTGNVLNGATNVGGDASNSKRIRIGATAHTNSGAAEPSIESCGYITFTQSGNFTVSVKAASSGSTSSRTFYLGTFDGTDFTDIHEFTVFGNVGETVDYTVAADGEKTYAIYVKPYDKSSDGVMDPAENTDIMQIDILPTTAVQGTTPEVVLSAPEVINGKLTVVGTFNDFTASLYNVDSITLNAALGKSVQAEAVWTANDIINLKDNGDGTVSFTAVVDDPGEDARFQAVAHYAGVDTYTSDVDTNAVSNLARYDAIAE